ncbi:putative cyclic nucleotide-gated ion channel 13 [Bienertia sinuspersici]
MALDPLFFYIPIIDGKNNCLKLDSNLEIIACILRTITELFYLLHIILQFCIGIVSPSRVLGRGELITDQIAIARRYLLSYFVVDVLVVLPFLRYFVIL